MKKNFKHVLLGTFIDESLKCANLTMTHLCKETGMGKASYENIRGGYETALLRIHSELLL